MNFLKIKKLVLLSTLITLSAEAKLYVWDNQQGVTEVTGCKVEDRKSTPYRVSGYTGSKSSLTENLRNSNNVKQSHLPVGSVVRLLKGKKKAKYENIYIIGVNSPKGLRKNRWQSKRNDTGYLFYKSVLPIENFNIELKGNPGLKGQVNLNGYKFSIVSEPTFKRLDCPGKKSMKGREYFLFNGYHTKKEEQITIGLSIDETGLFRSVKTDKRDEENYADENMADLNKYREATASVVAKQVVPVVKEEKEAPKEKTVKKEFGSKQSVEKKFYGVNPRRLVENDYGLGINNVICHPSGTLAMRDHTLTKVVTAVKSGETARVIQDWNHDNFQTKKVGNSEVIYIQVELSDRESSKQKVGWVSAKYVRDYEGCKELTKKKYGFPGVRISGIDDPKCCDYPTVDVPTHEYHGKRGQHRVFKARRSLRSGGYRKHAGADLYRFRYEPVRAVAPGKVIRRAYFYGDTYQVVVEHEGGFVARYGEVQAKNKLKLKVGQYVEMGQEIGHIDLVMTRDKRTGKKRPCCLPMLHFELYSGKLNGRPLSKKYRNMRGKFGRRDDLLDPTPYLIKWEKRVFHNSYK